MSLYFQKARELGQLILESEEAKALGDARAAGENIEQAEKDYHALVNQVLGMIQAAVYEEGMEIGGSRCKGCAGKG